MSTDLFSKSDRPLGISTAAAGLPGSSPVLLSKRERRVEKTRSRQLFFGTASMRTDRALRKLAPPCAAPLGSVGVGLGKWVYAAESVSSRSQANTPRLPPRVFAGRVAIFSGRRRSGLSRADTSRPVRNRIRCAPSRGSHRRGSRPVADTGRQSSVLSL